MSIDKKENIGLEVTEFLENMRHDIRTPLTGIIGFAQLIQKEAVSKKIKSYANDLVSATTALMDFQNDILDAIKASPEINPVVNTYFPLKKMVDNVVNLIKPKAIVKQLSLRIHYDNTLPTLIYSDYKRLYRILLELITNALKFTAKGCIEITVQHVSHTHDGFLLRLSVADSGIGISVQDQEVIFTRFKRLSPSSDGVYDGTGLGLSTVRQFITDLNGEIQVCSALTKGATFVCDIPILQTNHNWLHSDSDMNNTTTESSDIAVEKAHDQLSNSRILLIEDHPLTAKVTKLLLEDIGCEVTVARNGRAALSQCHHMLFDLIFVDIGLPDMNGFELIHKIKNNTYNQNQQTPMVALTAHIETEHYKQQEEDHIVDAIFQKPLLKSTAVNILNQFVLNMKTELPCIDLSLGAKRISQDEDAAKEMLLLLRKTLDQESSRFRQAFQNQDWETLSKQTHRLRGALAYCGAPQLEEACKHLDQALKKNKISDIKNTYTEMQAAVASLNNALGDSSYVV